MTPGQAVVPRNRRPRGQHPRPRNPDGRKRLSKKLPEYLEAHQVEALVRAAPNPRARLLFLIEWRAGLRISEALALEARDLSLDGEFPSLHVREGKGSKPRIVPVHPELQAALTSALEFGDVGQGDRLIRASRATSDRWIKKAATRAVELGVIPAGRRVSRPGTATPVTCWPTADRSTSCLAGWVTHRSTRPSSTWSWCRIRPGAWQACRDGILPGKAHAAKFESSSVVVVS